MQSRKQLSPRLKVYSTRQKANGKRQRRSPMQLVGLRLNDLATLFRSRYSRSELPDDDSGREDLEIALNHLACLAHPRGHISKWVEIWAPWLTMAEYAEIVPPILANPQRWKADALAWRLRLSMEQRTMLGITTIGAFDVPKAQRTKRRLKRERERRTQARRAKGAIPRKQYEAQSLTRSKPWIAEGVSRATWYRRRNDETTAQRETTPPTA